MSLKPLAKNILKKCYIRNVAKRCVVFKIKIERWRWPLEATVVLQWTKVDFVRQRLGVFPKVAWIRLWTNSPSLNQYGNMAGDPQWVGLSHLWKVWLSVVSMKRKTSQKREFQRVLAVNDTLTQTPISHNYEPFGCLPSDCHESPLSTRVFIGVKTIQHAFLFFLPAFLSFSWYSYLV